MHDWFAGGEDMASLLTPAKLVAGALRDIQRARETMYPGLAGGLRIMSRLAPGLVLRQLSKGVEQALAKS